MEGKISDGTNPEKTGCGSRPDTLRQEHPPFPDPTTGRGEKISPVHQIFGPKLSFLKIVVNRATKTLRYKRPPVPWIINF